MRVAGCGADNGMPGSGEVRGEPGLASPVSAQRRSQRKGRLDLTTGPALSPEDRKLLGRGRIRAGADTQS